MNRLRSVPIHVEAAVALGRARLLIAFWPLQSVIDRIGPVSSKKVDDDRVTRRVISAIERLERWVPFRAKCFEQALAGHWMLGRRGIPTTIHYGISRSPDPMCAHVWLSHDGQVLCGGNEMAAFVEVIEWGKGATRSAGSIGGAN